MANTINEIASQCDLFLCVECGKCVAACPMTEIFKDFSYEISPRGMVEKTLMDFDVLTDIGIWFCLTCDVCTEICPAGVRYRDFVERVRQLALREGLTENGLFCQRCGRFFLPRHTLEYISEQLEDGAVPDEYLTLCPRCRKYDFGEKVKEAIPGRRKVLLKRL
jgi:ferredoxin